MEVMSLIRRNSFWAAIAMLGLAQATTVGQGSPANVTFTKSIQPFFAKNCYGCHNPKLKTGGLNLEAYTSAASLSQDPDQSEKILKKLQAGEMPPKGLPRPSADEVKTVTTWIESELDLQTESDSGRVLTRRLNRVEYNNTVRDLLGVDVRPADDFPQDDSACRGAAFFRCYGSRLRGTGG